MSDNIQHNRTLLEKADLALADLTSDGGVLQPAQAKEFIRTAIKESKIMPMATVVPMKAQKQLIEKIRFSGRVLRRGQEAQALPAGDRQKPALGKVELDTKLFKAEVRLDNEVLEDSIEQDNLKATVMTLMGEAIARDMDEIIIQGDTSSADTFLATLNGILKQATSNVVDAGIVNINKSIMKSMIKTLPSEFLRDKKRMRFLTSVDAEIDYRDSLAERATAVGDKFLEQDASVMYSGVPIEAVPMFPENLGVGSNETNIVLTDPKNIQVGIWRKITIETDKLISDGVMLIVATLRFDVKYAEETAVVKGIKVKVT